MIRVAVMGATGYTGGELLRFLAPHPQVEITAVTTSSHPGQPLGRHQPQLDHLGLVLEAGDEAVVAVKADVVFLCLPHGVAMNAAPALLERGCRVVDLGADFRLSDPDAYERWYRLEHRARELLQESVYGLPELFRPAISGARLVANPGCYPTAALLALAPWKGRVEVVPVLIDAKSGVSGAGRKSDAAYSYCELTGSLKPYSLAGTHRHTPEIEAVASRWYGDRVLVSFNPHLVPMSRGLLATAYLRLRQPLTAAEAHELCRQFYADEPFVDVLAPGLLPETRLVTGTNRCQLGVVVDERAGLLVVTAAIDNLGKGAAGQAVQNLNIMFGLPETTGLRGPALVP